MVPPVRSRLDAIGVDDVIALNAALREAAAPATTMAEAAHAITSLVHRQLVLDDLAPGCALVRLYTTVRDAGSGDADQHPHLVLLGTSGDLPAWNDRTQSAAHAAIPLDRADILAARAPMIAGLLSELGIDIDSFVELTGGDARLIHHQDYGIFHVEQAAGSPLIPAQDFVREHGIRSVVGCGGGLPSGEVFVLVLFSKVDLDVDAASLFRTVAFGIKAALVPHTFRVFDSNL